jgi:hypothetical protein
VLITRSVQRLTLMKGFSIPFWRAVPTNEYLRGCSWAVCDTARYDPGSAPWVALPCGHAACAKCLTDYAGNGNTRCPTCSASFLPPLYPQDVVIMCLPDAASRESGGDSDGDGGGGGGDGGGGKGGGGMKREQGVSMPDTVEEKVAKRIAKELRAKLHGALGEVSYVGPVTTDDDGETIRWCRVDLENAMDVGGGIRMGSVELRHHQLLFMDDVEVGKATFITCSSCAFELPRDCFSQAQLKKRKQKHTARCRHCTDTNRTSMPAKQAAGDASEPAGLNRNQRKALAFRQRMQPPPPPPPPPSPPPTEAPPAPYPQAEPEPSTGRQAQQQTDATLVEEEEVFDKVHTARVGWV